MWKGFFVRDNSGKREGFGKRIRETANRSKFRFNVMFAHKLLTFYLHDIYNIENKQYRNKPERLLLLITT